MPFKSKAQMRWMYANHPEMAKRWSKHTENSEDLPEKVDEILRRALLEVTPHEDPDLDPDEADEILAQLGDYDLEDDEEEEEDVPPPPSKPVSKPKFSMASMMKKAITSTPPPPSSADVPAEEVPEFDDEPAPVRTPITAPQKKRKRGSYSTSRKMASLGKPKGRFNPEYISLRSDIGQFEDRIKELRGEGMNSMRIAQAINDEMGLGKGERLAPTDVSDYLKSIGEITRGAGSAPQDLGSTVPHNHSDPGEWHEDCPACTFSTSFDSEWEYPPHVLDALKNLGEFSVEEAIQAVAQLPEFADAETGKYSDVHLPGGYQNLGDLVKQVIRGSGLFEPLDPNWSKKMFTPAASKLRWRYAGGGIEEGKSMGDWYCPSCEEGNHHRCKSERCACCGGDAIREMFTFEAANRPVGSTPFQDWGKLGSFGTALKQQADTMKGAAYQTQDGKLLFYKNQMQVGEQPLVADVTKGVWSQDPSHPTQGMGSMQSVFTPKTSVG